MSEEIARLTGLIAHMSIKPHHAKTFKSGSMRFNGCSSCAQIQAIWDELHESADADLDPNEVSREREAAFVPLEEQDDDPS